MLLSVMRRRGRARIHPFFYLAKASVTKQVATIASVDYTSPEPTVVA